MKDMDRFSGTAPSETAHSRTTENISDHSFFIYELLFDMHITKTLKNIQYGYKRF